MTQNLIKDALARLAAAESTFLGSQFLAPVVRGRGVSVRIAGVRCTLRVVPPEFHGWGVFRPLSHSVAALGRPASGTEPRQYLSLFPAVRLIVCGGEGNRPLALPASASDSRFAIASPVEVQLSQDFDLFDTLIARFDGLRFWFDEADPRADPAAATYLRRELAEMVESQKLSRPGLSAGQRQAYAAAYARRAAAVAADQRYQSELRLKAALAHAGASLCDFGAVDGDYRVTYTVGGRRHTSVVRQHDLSVRSAGICLSGQDRKFDLSSLVGVLQESDGNGAPSST